MAWTDPRTWATGELVTAALLNTHLRDNLNYLLSPNNDFVRHVDGTGYTTTSSSFANIDGTNLSLSVTSHGGLFLIVANVPLTSVSAACVVSITIDDGGSNLGDATYGLYSDSLANASDVCATLLYIGVLSSGAHTLNLQWKRNSGSGTPTIGANTPVLFGAVEG